MRQWDTWQGTVNEYLESLKGKGTYQAPQGDGGIGGLSMGRSPHFQPGYTGEDYNSNDDLRRDLAGKLGVTDFNAQTYAPDEDPDRSGALVMAALAAFGGGAVGGMGAGSGYESWLPGDGNWQPPNSGYENWLPGDGNWQPPNSGYENWLPGDGNSVDPGALLPGESMSTQSISPEQAKALNYGYGAPTVGDTATFNSVGPLSAASGLASKGSALKGIADLLGIGSTLGLMFGKKGAPPQARPGGALPGGGGGGALGIAGLAAPRLANVSKYLKTGGSTGSKAKKEKFFGILRGDAGGQDDVIPIMAAPGEYVFDAESVAHLGDGNNEAGAKKLDAMRLNIRKHKRSGPLSKIPARSKKPEEYMEAA